MNNLIIAPLLIPLLTGVILLFLRKHIVAQKVLSMLSGLAIIATSGVLLGDVLTNGVGSYQLGGWQPPFGIVLVADSLSVLLVLFSSIILVATTLFTYKGLDLERKNYYYYPLVQFLLTGIIGAFLTGDLFNLFVFFEVLLMSSYALIVLGGTKTQLGESIKYVLVNVISSALFVTAVAFLYSMTGTLNMADLSQRIAEIGQPGLVTVVALLFLIVFGMKAAIFPLYFWLPGSYSAPPPVISAIFAGLLTKVGIYAIYRVFTIIFYHHPEITHQIIGILATITMIVGVIGAVAYNDLHKILVYNVVAGVGFILLGLSSFNEDGLFGGIFYLLHDMMIKAALFLLVGAIIAITQTTKMNQASGIIKHYPLLGWSFLVAALSLAGVPPLSGFFGKLALIQGGFLAEQYVFVGVLLLSSLLVLYSVMRIFFLVILGEDRLPETHNSGQIKGLVYPSVFLLVLSFLMGMGAEFVYPYVADATFTLLNPEIYIEAVLKE
ncbi:Na+/H+ antiporter subunit D [Halalkalibacter oceani]|uniref:Na+/H+ antiporter subunit D n=1 Tax=Halalkalibacter oceani TaxID=1653776 RepID=A0A9X2DPP1_9BACI|nr:Na+/H+ antiporter subunit D [Halalkalibacter oceani]MCM3712768.1 Na+/H+ antiporter subunit D [Halalkalibacter oceani]